MIAELLDLAERLAIPTPCPFERMPVHYFIELSGEGQVLGITPVCTRSERELGKMMDCPAYFPIKTGTNDEIQASGGGGFSVAEAGHGDIQEIFCSQITLSKGKPPEIAIIEPEREKAEDEANDPNLSGQNDDSDFGAKESKNQYYRHARWLGHIENFIRAHPEIEISKALKCFIEAKYRLTHPTIFECFFPCPSDKTGPEEGAHEQEGKSDNTAKERSAKLKQIGNARFTFRVNGMVLLRNPEFREWWESVYAEERCRILLHLPYGNDGFSFQSDEGSKRLTPVFPHVPNIPGGGTYCPLASFDKAATRSFGLEKHTLSMSLTTAERATAALKWLLQDKHSHCSLGKKLVVIFWAVPPVQGAKPCPHDFAALLNEPDALQVLDFFRNIHGHAAVAPNAGQFYCAILSSPKSRITVRSWHRETIGRVGECANEYFEAVSMPDVVDSDQRKTSAIGELASAIVPAKSKGGPSPTIYSTILQTALFAKPLPHSFLESALSRQSIELAKGYSDKKNRAEFESRLRARTALVKLYFYSNSKGNPMNEDEHQNQDHPAYLCGRTLALLDKIHNAAHRKSTASSPAGRYYGSASSMPAIVFPRLCKLARIHLEKIEDRNQAITLDGELAAIISKFAGQARWPRTLALEDQGRFAIGFYYERLPK